MKIYSSVSELIGNTPLVELKNYNRKFNLNATIIGKIEYLNPAGSVKDRIAEAMIDDAETKGLLKRNSNYTIIEPTSGNTGIGLAMISAIRGYRLILTMPDTMSAERINLLTAYGAEIVLTEGSKGMTGSIEKADQLSAEIPNSYIPSQFTNPVNPEIHTLTTGVEIWNDTDGRIDIFVAGVGSGGTISGTGSYLKSKNPNIKIIAVEPADSPFLSKGYGGAHKLQGIGAGFIPANLNTEIYDEIITVTTEEAYSTGKELAVSEGMLTGITSGAAVWAAKELALREENREKIIVALLPDSGDRYLSTDMFK